MTSLAEDYDDKFFRMHIPWKQEYDEIAAILDTHLAFKSVVDLGCGNGYIIDELDRRGKTVYGIDGSSTTQRFNPRVHIMDLTIPLQVGRYDLVICTEVAEHIDEKYADVLVNSICDAARGYIFFSAARAGFGGHCHVNEQERPYWIEKFQRRSVAVDEQLSETIRQDLLKRTKRIWWFAANAFVLYRGI
jgi:2-polyprenyl-3-methyl-5-hydroxy-6-metoxy-1,4-benzoquinol methylase